jgi:hypothetical protein
MKIVDMDTSEPLTEKALAEAMLRIEKEPHGGWADLIVHQAQVVAAVRLVGRHNGKDPQIRLRTQTDTKLGVDDWKVCTRSIEVRVQFEKA